MQLTCHTLPPIRWLALPASAVANPGAEIAVYRVPIAENQGHAPHLLPLLTAAEQQRARRYHAAADYHRFIISRAALRRLLGACLGQPPAGLEFVAGPHKKPLLATVPHLHYNVAHSGNWVLIAIAPVEIGVDIEKTDPDFPFQGILADSFSLPEQAFIRQHPAPATAFYQLWTRKEAFVKATAQGIEADFSQVPALAGPHQWAATHPSPVADWVVSSFAPAEGYTAAVAYPAAVAASQLRFYEVADLLHRGQ
ncbi:MAG: 4'-phosphopantetheinyl transferase superfamily protein [Hymenobacter sp.]|nr:MAG: 4'-phosphopantetheinyl transferase superfamily protein [Hymenobacter sp.]